MKNVSIAAFVAILCATNAFGAPSADQTDRFLAELFTGKSNITDPTFLADQYECLVNVLKVESEAHGLGNLWALSKARFASNIAKWKKCGSYSSATDLMCHLTQAYTAYGLVTDYVRVAQENDVAFFLRVFPKYFMKCALPSIANIESDMIEDMGKTIDLPTTKDIPVESIIEYFTCVNSNIKLNIEGTGLENIYKKYETAFEKPIEYVGQCGGFGQLEELCIYLERVNFQKAYKEFFNDLSQVDSEFARKLDTFIQAKCATNQQMDEFAAFLPNHHWSLEGNNIFSSRATPAESIISALICMNSTIIENLEGTGHEGIYAKYQPTFANIIKRLRKCGESEFCVFKEVIVFTSTYGVLFTEISFADSELAIKIHKLIETEC